MTSIVTLDFSRIRPAEWSLPDVGILDIDPLEDVFGQKPGHPLRGHVLELNDNASLRRSVVVAPGVSILKLRLSTGEIFSQTIEVKDEGAGTSVSFEIAGRVQIRRRPQPAAAGDRVPRQSPTPRKSDRKHWAVVDRSDSRVGDGQLKSFLRAFASDVVDEKQRNRGIVRVQSNARSFLTTGLSLQSDSGADAALLGDIAAVQPVKLYGTEDALSTRWVRPLNDRRKVDSQENEAKTKRYFAVSYMLGNDAVVKSLACVPGNWRSLETEGGEKAKLSALKIRYVQSPRGDDNGSAVRVQVDDSRVQGLLEFMQTGDLYSSRSLIGEAHIHLYEKTHNPYAAAAAGYVIARIRFPGENDEWGLWVRNLAVRFPAIPDGQILLAAVFLQGSRETRARVMSDDPDGGSEHHRALRAVLEAVRRGPPIYRLGIRLLLTNIYILQGIYEHDEFAMLQLNEAQAYVDDLNSRVDRTQPFCVFDVSRMAL